MNTNAADHIPAMNDNPLPVRPLLFFGIALISFIVIISLPDTVLGPLNRAFAHLTGLCLTLFGGHAVVTGDIITLNSFRVWIITECTPIYCILLFAAFIFATPVSMKERFVGLLAGSAFLTSADILRIALVTVIGAGYPALFEAVHVYLAQVVMLLLVLATSFIWLRIVMLSKEPNMPFLPRVLAVASIIFFPWLVFNEAYVRALDRLMICIFAMAGYRFVIPYGHHVYFQTFNTVLLLALIFAERRLSPCRKAAWAAAGLAVLAGGHLLFRIGNVLLTAFSWQPALRISICISVIGEYLLPLLLWTAAIRGFKTFKEQ